MSGDTKGRKIVYKSCNNIVVVIIIVIIIITTYTITSTCTYTVRKRKIAITAADVAVRGATGLLFKAIKTEPVNIR